MLDRSYHTTTHARYTNIRAAIPSLLCSSCMHWRAPLIWPFHLHRHSSFMDAYAYLYGCLILTAWACLPGSGWLNASAGAVVGPAARGGSCLGRPKTLTWWPGRYCGQSVSDHCSPVKVTGGLTREPASSPSPWGPCP